MVGRTSYEFVFAPAGTFLMGTNAEHAPAVASQFPGVQAEWILKEAPAHEVYLQDYHIARTPITNQLWAEYIYRISSLPPPDWADSPPNPKHPVSGITYEEADTFCSWLSEVTGHRITLPTESQWEKAARGVDGREWPWGNEFSAEKCNTREGGYGGGHRCQQVSRRRKSVRRSRHGRQRRRVDERSLSAVSRRRGGDQRLRRASAPGYQGRSLGGKRRPGQVRKAARRLCSFAGGCAHGAQHAGQREHIGISLHHSATIQALRSSRAGSLSL